MLEPVLYIYFEYLLLLRRLTINAEKNSKMLSKVSLYLHQIFISYQTMLASTMNAVLFISVPYRFSFLYLNTDFCRILMAISYVNVQNGGVDNCRILTLYSVIIDPSCNITDFALLFVKLE